MMITDFSKFLIVSDQFSTRLNNKWFVFDYDLWLCTLERDFIFIIKLYHLSSLIRNNHKFWKIRIWNYNALPAISSHIIAVEANNEQTIMLKSRNGDLWEWNWNFSVSTSGSLYPTYQSSAKSYCYLLSYSFIALVHRS